MYIKFTFQEGQPIICLTDPTYVGPPSYSYGPPQIIDQLPPNTPCNVALYANKEDKKQQCYYLDCGNLNLSAVELAVDMYNAEVLGGGQYDLRSISLAGDEVLPFIKTMKQALIKAELQKMDTHHYPDTKFDFTNRHLLFAAGGLAIAGIAAVAVFKKRH
tara:strand:+ start:168 stop:647 length:480 start_codon:yes stop_codon:yes gene_type:complete